MNRRNPNNRNAAREQPGRRFPVLRGCVRIGHNPPGVQRTGKTGSPPPRTHSQLRPPGCTVVSELGTIPGGYKAGGSCFSAWGKFLAWRRMPGLGEGQPRFSTHGGGGRLSDPRPCAPVTHQCAPTPKPSRQIAQCNPVFLRSNTPFSVHNRPVLLCLSRLLALYPVKNRL